VAVDEGKDASMGESADGSKRMTGGRQQHDLEVLGDAYADVVDKRGCYERSGLGPFHEVNH
jgi:hypothetical protein